METRRTQSRQPASKSQPKKKTEELSKNKARNDSIKGKQKQAKTNVTEKITRSKSKMLSPEPLQLRSKSRRKTEAIEDKTKNGKRTVKEEKKPEKRRPIETVKADVRLKDQQKLRKTRQSSPNIITITAEQFENFEKVQQEITNKTKKKAQDEKKLQKRQESTSKDRKHSTSQNIWDIQSDSDKDDTITVDAVVDISIDDENEEEEDNRIHEISSDSQQEKEEQPVKRRGRPPSKNKVGIKKTFSSTEQKLSGAKNKESVKKSIPARQTRSRTHIAKDDQPTKQQQSRVKEDEHEQSVEEIESNHSENEEKLSKKLTSNKKQVVEEEGSDRKVESKRSRGRPRVNRDSEIDDLKKQVDVQQQNPSKKRGRQPKSEEKQLNRRYIGEEKTQDAYIKHNELEKKGKQQKDSSPSQKENNPAQFITQSLILQKKPAKKEKAIEEKNYQKINVQPQKNHYDAAIEMLQEYSMPEEIPCRESEKKDILEFIEEGLSNNGSSSCLYISGVPGIGKTASFLEVIKKLEKEKKDEFTFIHVNAMNLSNPENLYNILVKQITGVSCSSKQKSCQILNELFTRGKLSKRYQKYGENIDMKNKVILLDELDYLVTQDQELLYNLMEWPHHKYSKLTIIGIANTMNLPENLMNKIKSRMGSRRLVFNQYNHKQISEIIKTRLDKIDQVFESSAIEYACKKIAISSSDIRKTLKVLRKAVEVCQKENLQNPESVKVTIPIIQQAYSQLYSSPILQSIQKLQLHHRLIILSIALENKHRGIGIAYLSESYSRYKIMISNLGINNVLNINQMKLIMNHLSILNLISMKEKEILKDTQLIGLDPNKKHYSHVVDIQITSNFSVDDITNSLKDDEIYLKFQFQF